MSAPTAILLARLANMLESARLAVSQDHNSAGLEHIKRAQELLEVVRDA